MEHNYVILALILFPMVGGTASYVIGRVNKTVRDYFLYFVTAVELLGAVYLLTAVNSTLALNDLVGLGMHFKADGFRISLSILTAFAWLVTTLTSKEYFAGSRNRNRYYLFMLFTLAATQGIFLSADLYTTFIFFELMSFASYAMVQSKETPEAQKASNTYLTFAVIGGLVTLMGLFMLNSLLGTLDFELMGKAATHVTSQPTLYIAGALALFGFAVKAGMYPLHTWLPTSYVESPAPASALLSAILSKCGIFGIIVISADIFLHDYNWGVAIVILGTLTMLTGAMLAVFSNDLKKTLAYSSMSQIGFIIVAVGMQGVLGDENALAVRGTILHMFNHSFIKLALFMAAGVIFMNMKHFDLNKIRGFGRKKPVLMFVFGMAILGIIGMPLWNGYISKTLIHESIVEYIGLFPLQTGMATFFQVIEALFMFAGALTCTYMLKIFVAVFIEKNPDEALQAQMDSKKKYMAPLTTAVLVLVALIMPIFGMIPWFTQDVIANAGQGFMSGHDPLTAVHYFSLINLRGAAVSISIGAVVYFCFVRVWLMKKDANGVKVYANVWPKWLDIQRVIYQPVVLTFLPFVGTLCARIVGEVGDSVVWLARKIIFFKASDVFVPPTDDNFATYDARSKRKETIIKTLSYGLLLFLLGAVAILLYLTIW